MQGATRQELYYQFIEFISDDIQHERRNFNRRMLNVFIWCFFLPALLSITVLILVKLNILPQSWRHQLDWLLLILPILYSLYILSFEVLKRVPFALRRGGIASALAQPIQEGQWRNRVVEKLEKNFQISSEEWNWIRNNFKIDLEAMQYRARYITALAGAVFFLLMQGIDSLTGQEEKITWIKSPNFGWIKTSTSDFSEFVGLGLFLVLLYLSGNQTYHSLRRYLNCAELVHEQLKLKNQD